MSTQNSVDLYTKFDCVPSYATKLRSNFNFAVAHDTHTRGRSNLLAAARFLTPPSPSPLPFHPAPATRIPPISTFSAPLRRNTNTYTMANIRTATIAAALFCLFTVSLARATPQIDDSATTLEVAHPFSDVDPALRLPTESDAKASAEADPSSEIMSAVPLAEISFRPINRRFRPRSKRPCRHHFKFHPSMREKEEISYGNDMILSSGENSDFEQPIVRGGGKRIPGRWMRTHHHHHHHLRHHGEDSDSDDEEEVKKVVFKRFNYDRFDREKSLNKLRKRFRVHNHNEEEMKKKKGGFMRGVRKFLNNYF